MAVSNVRNLNALLLALGYDGRAVSPYDFCRQERFPHVARLLGWLLNSCCGSFLADSEKRILDRVDNTVSYVRETATLLAKHTGFAFSADNFFPMTLSSAATALQHLVALCRRLLRQGREATRSQQHLKIASDVVKEDNVHTSDPRSRREPTVTAAVADVATANSASGTLPEGSHAVTTAAAAAAANAGTATRATPAAPATAGNYAKSDPLLGLMGDQRLLSQLQNLKRAQSLAAPLVVAGAAIRKILERHNSNGRRLYWQRTEVFLEQLGLYLDTHTAAREHAAIEAVLRKQLQKVQVEMKEAQVQCEHIQRDINYTTANLQKATQENECVKKRLEAVHNLKPHFQEEYDKLMAELHATYDKYITSVRNARFLEQEAEKPRQEERELQKEQQQHLQHVQEKLREDAAQLLRAFDVDSSDEEEDFSLSVTASPVGREADECALLPERESLNTARRKRPSANEAFQNLQHRQTRVFHQHALQPERLQLLESCEAKETSAMWGESDFGDCIKLGERKADERRGKLTSSGEQASVTSKTAPEAALLESAFENRTPDPYCTSLV